MANAHMALTPKRQRLTLFISAPYPIGRHYYYPHFTDEEIRARRENNLPKITEPVGNLTRI